MAQVRIDNMELPKRLKMDMGIKCPWCMAINTVRKWDKHTYKQCITDEMRGDYLSLRMIKTFDIIEKTLYKCPNCEFWVRANQLILMTDNKELRELGGKPIISFESIDVDS